MNIKTGRLENGSTLIRSVVLVVLGLVCIPLGFSFFPVVGIAAGTALVGAGIYPWLRSVRQRKVNVLIGAVSDNNLDSMRLPVAILSASKERDGFDFDPRQVDPASAVFGPLKAEPSEDMTDPRIYERNLVDLNDDGVPDLIFYFDGDTAGIGARDKEACLWAKTRDGERIYGCNRVEYGLESGLNEMIAYK
ncbi:MAG: hypothetical protein WAW37_01665 [Syntrophobacteraceae bacterium]